MLNALNALSSLTDARNDKRLMCANTGSPRLMPRRTCLKIRVLCCKFGYARAQGLKASLTLTYLRTTKLMCCNFGSLLLNAPT